MQHQKYVIVIWVFNILVLDVHLSPPKCSGLNNTKVIISKGSGDSSIQTFSGCLDGNNFRDTRHIRIISCNNEENNIQTLGQGYVKNLDKLESFFIYGCEIGSIEPGSFQNVPKLTKIIIENYNSQARQLIQLKNKIFDQTPSLEFLELHCGISSIEKGALANLSKLKEVNLEGNELTDINSNWFPENSKIETFILSHNHIQEIPSGTFILLSKLVTLDLSYNKISVIRANAFKGLDKLEYLKLQFNNISKMSVSVLPEKISLREIYLYNNTINFLSQSFMEKTLENKVSLSVWNNPLICSCLDFVFDWMYRQKVDTELFVYKSTNGEDDTAVCVVDLEHSKTCVMDVNAELSMQYAKLQT